MYNMDTVHVSDEEFRKNVSMYLDKVEIKGRVVVIHNEDGQFAYLVPKWMMNDFLKEKINEKRD